jgi:hypothetical protein
MVKILSEFTSKIPVFVSSTFKDLIPYRNAVKDILNDKRADIRGMETFGARTEKSRITCIEEVTTSEIFIGIIGMCYGSKMNYLVNRLWN